MDELENLLAKLTETDSKLDALLANETLTAEQQAEHDTLVTDRQKTVKAVATEENKREREAERTTLSLRLKAGRGRKTQVDAPPLTPLERHESEANTLPAGVRVHRSIKNFKGTRDGRPPEVRAYRFGMWALAKLSLDMPGRFQFREALDFYDKVESWQIAHHKYNAANGQVLVPEEFGTDLIDLRDQFGVARRICRNITMSSDTRTDPVSLTGLTAYFRAEGQPGIESNKTWGDIRLVAKDVMVLSRYSNELNADAVIDIGDDLAGEISRAFAEKEDRCLFDGDGTSTYGGILGVAHKLRDVDGAGTDSAGLLTATGNLWSEFILNDFSRLLGILPQYADTNETVWVTHRAFYFQVMERLALAGGGVTTLDVREGNRRPRPLFMGYPVEFTPVLGAAEANSQMIALLGDFKKGVHFGDRQQESIAFSEHATVGGENVFERNQIAIRGTERFDINVFGVGTATVAGPIVGLQTAAA